MIELAEKMGDTFAAWVPDRYPALRPFIERVGNTPLLAIPGAPEEARIYAKRESENPCGTIKDRVALAMMWRALSQGYDPRSQEILEYSGGQLSVALAQICAALEAPAQMVLSDATAPSLVEAVRSCGARVELVPKSAGFWGVMQRAVALKAARPDYWFLYQHQNPANVAMHRSATAEEILRQLPGVRIDAWIAAIGTGGTLAGVGSRLREVHPEISIYGVTPAELPYGSPEPPNGLPKFAGSGGLGCGRKQQFVQAIEDSIGGHFHIFYPEALAEMARFEEATGIRIGSSAAANLLAARRVAARLGPQAVIVTVFPSAGSAEEWEAIQKQRLERASVEADPSAAPAG